jgi:hypothetical protein
LELHCGLEALVVAVVVTAVVVVSVAVMIVVMVAVVTAVVLLGAMEVVDPHFFSTGLATAAMVRAKTARAFLTSILNI